MLKIKGRPDGKVERFKARLVTQGFRQVKRLDYQETFAPVVRYGSVRILAALSAQYCCEIHQMNVPTALLKARRSYGRHILEAVRRFCCEMAGRQSVEAKRELVRFENKAHYAGMRSYTQGYWPWVLLGMKPNTV